ncbi:OmpH family outer membrane protein [uncultured Gilvimarinus sp.]|uniref:coiled-coil domain-containing protein n=1 Tax=uncultured Gilvimarinus sp. TaxID=1689143 RepID=UPI0030EBCD4F
MHLTDQTKSPEIGLDKLESIVGDIDLQPKWRAESDRAADYYDDKQFTPAEIHEMEERGQPVIIHNLIKPTINGVLGMEARTRTDSQVLADDETGADVAEGLNEKLHEAARITDTDRACADAYAAEIKAGLGWVEVTRGYDPFGYPYEVNYVHRREIFWDWHSQRNDLSDCRWLMRKRWLEVDELVAAFPKHRELIESVASGFEDFSNFGEDEDGELSEDLMSAYQIHTTSSIETHDYWDPDRKRAMASELWYRVWVTRPVIKFGDQVEEYDQKSRKHLLLLSTNKATVEMATFPKMRLAFFVGPHRLADIPSPYTHNKFPYVPFWGYREDRTNIPYGMIRSMMPAQDEINKRRSKLTWLLNAKLIVKDDDAIDDVSDDELLDTVYSGDGVININPYRHNKSGRGFELLSDMGVSNQQFTLMQDSMKLVQDTAGVYSSLLGQEGAATSGVAIDSLVEQGTTTLAEINDNYRFARKTVHELLLSLIVDDIGEKETEIRINVNKPQRTKVVVLNKRIDDGGISRVTNSVMRTKTRVVLSDIQNTPGYRQQMAKSLMDMAAQLPEQYAVALVDMIVELSDIPNRDEVLKRIRQASGVGINPEDMTEEEQAAAQRKQQIQQMMEDLEIQTKQTELADMQAKVRELNAKAAQMEQMTPVERDKTAAEIKEINAKIKEKATDIAKKKRELAGMMRDEINYEQKRLPSPEQAA